uniref:NADH-ubiquinone oxidoreductase chain 6 n=1 Tax=Trigonopterus sp. AH-2016 TaxID=1903843 RepID=A0A343C460_9CUCU|nr:NADH dehydrogenase subunit 6 [Trigonopterus sp. AH-2016]
MYIFTLNFLFALAFMTMNHPLSLGGILLVETILLALASGFLFFNFWFGYILFLIMVSGMLIMFIYMTSVASNEKFKMPQFHKYWILSSITGTLFALKADKFLLDLLNLSISTYPQTTHISYSSLTKYFNYPGMLALITLMIYLLITLIAIVKIIGKSSGSLRHT